MEQFRVHVPDDVLDDVRTRLVRTPWPEAANDPWTSMHDRMPIVEAPVGLWCCRRRSAAHRVAGSSATTTSDRSAITPPVGTTPTGRNPRPSS